MANRDRKNMHFDPKVRELTIQMWLSGKSEEEINFALYKLTRQKYSPRPRRRSNHYIHRDAERRAR